MWKICDAICPSGSPPPGAGNIRRCTPTPSYFRAHPRRCGEHAKKAAKDATDAGSPPQVRGTCPPGSGAPQATAAHPRRCGEHRRRRALPLRVPGSPRRCGEHPPNGIFNAIGVGSPPQVRGTSRAASGPSRRRVAGSPPQVRGTSMLDRGLQQVPRLTPAGAGNISPASPALPRRRAHPRRCGEHANKSATAMLPTGSPPQVRGTSRLRERAARDRGLTPAGAGNIVRRGRGGRRTPAHPAGAGNMRAAAETPRKAGSPRRCGEHPLRRRRGELTPGSPPQVRGTSHAPLARRTRHGLTPAGAGNMTGR